MGFYPHGPPPPFGGYHGAPPPMHGPPPPGMLGHPPPHHGPPPHGHPPPMMHGPPPPMGYPPHGPPPPHGHMPPPHMMPHPHHPGGAPPPRPPYGGPPPPGYGHPPPQHPPQQPPGYPAPGAGPPPGEFSARPYGAPPAEAGGGGEAGPPGAGGQRFPGAGPPPPTAPAVDFAAEKPAAYRAFEQMAVRSGEGGTQIGLPNSMCLDRHVHDFLLCLRCWLPRTLGEPRATGRHWRLQSLDLSRNLLSDENICRVMDCLKSLDVRVERLLLAGNCARQRGCNAITEYIWNCPDALVELDVTDNEIFADPKAGPNPGSDVVSALLRCIYNHGAYPVTVDYGREGLKIVPLLLRMGGNGILHPEKLLKQIRSKGGKERVRVCASADPYPHTGKEYLSVCLPDFLVQRALKPSQDGAGGAPPPQAHAQQAPPPAAAPAIMLTPAPAPVVAAAPVAALAPAAAGDSKRTRRKRSKSKDGKKHKRSKKEGGRRRDAGDAAQQPPPAGVAGAPPAAAGAPGEAPPPGAAPAPAPVGAGAAGGQPEDAARFGRGSRSRSGSSSSENGGRRGRAPAQPLGVVEGQVLADTAPPAAAGAPAAPAAAAPAAGGTAATYRAPTEDEAKKLQIEVDDQLQKMGGLPSEQATRDMLAEFVCCMVVARKPLPEVKEELRNFIGNHTVAFMDWFEKHMEERFSL